MRIPSSTLKPLLIKAMDNLKLSENANEKETISIIANLLDNAYNSGYEDGYDDCNGNRLDDLPHPGGFH
jgi:hypothetical protein